MEYTSILPTDPNGLSLGMPTVDPSAAIAGIGANPAGSTGLAPPTAPGMPTPTVPGAPPVSGAAPGGMGGGGPGFFSQGGVGQFALGAIQTLGSLWNSFQQNKLAKESMKFQKEAYTTNLANQEQSYNTALEDRINSRYVTEGKTQAQADSYIEKNRL